MTYEIKFSRIIKDEGSMSNQDMALTIDADVNTHELLGAYIEFCVGIGYHQESVDDAIDSYYQEQIK